ncbi:glutathione S-transferase C-terminal domain-containing protein, partial [Dokdonella sp.]|uniref:glutathione S-transferase C-terminal domain-containing protein n=1 Tax=Dokdonella sp. TaxID=2291710 RepID=UPI003C697F8D
FPMACSLSARIAALEADIELNYHHADIFDNGELIGEAGNLRTISAMGKVPVLVTNHGDVLTESAAVLQYIADLSPDSNLAPPCSSLGRYQLQQWLSFVGTELHKGFNFPTFGAGTPDSVKSWVRGEVSRPLAYVARHLEKTGDYLLGSHFSVADAYLIWALLLIKASGFDMARWPALAAYVERTVARPRVKSAVDLEWAMSKSGNAS